MNILRRALLHQNLFANIEDAYPGAPLSAPVQTQTSHHLSGGLQVENYLIFTATFNLSGSAPTWSVSSAVYEQNGFLDLLGTFTLVPWLSFNKGQVSTGTGTVDPIQARVDINSSVDPNGWISTYPGSWGILMHNKSGNKVPLVTMTRHTVGIIRFTGQSRFDAAQLTTGDAMTLKIYREGNPR